VRKGPKCSDLNPLDACINRLMAMTRAKVESHFRVIKRQFGLMRIRYRDLV
jgi:hypothetical protein